MLVKVNTLQLLLLFLLGGAEGHGEEGKGECWEATQGGEFFMESHQ